jgi:hypothetical protein
MNMNDNNLSYRANPTLKKSGVTLNYNQQELEEYVKCSNDPIYFIENYVKVIHVDRGLVPFEMYDFQKEMIKAMHENSRTIILSSRQMGKCMNNTTKLTLSNKTTGETAEMTIEDFFNLVKERQVK